MQGLPSKKDNLESDHELDHGLCEKKKKKNDWEEDVCCRTYIYGCVDRKVYNC